MIASLVVAGLLAVYAASAPPETPPITTEVPPSSTHSPNTITPEPGVTIVKYTTLPGDTTPDVTPPVEPPTTSPPTTVAAVPDLDPLPAVTPTTQPPQLPQTL